MRLFPLKRSVWVICLLGLILISFLAVFIIQTRITILDTFKDEYARFNSVKLGMSEEEVIKLLDKPNKVYYGKTAPKDYYEKGYSYKRRAISNKVFIYIGSEPIAYVYFNEQNRVEDVFVGGS